MLTPKENLMETIRGGSPDRLVKQYEALKIFYSPFMNRSRRVSCGGEPVVNSWGVTYFWPAGTPGQFPVHTPEKIVIRDITRWRDCLKAPDPKASEQEWESVLSKVSGVDRDRYLITAGIAPGIFEQCHNLCEIQNTLTYFYLEPEALRELIDFLADWEMQYAEDICIHMHPEAILHHDDWGTQLSTFMSPEMFHEFLFPAYQKVYARYREMGVKIIVHHSDSYAATLVPDMIDLGIDIWQGALSTNDLPKLIGQYGGKISFMGGIDCSKVDFAGSDRDTVRRVVEQTCRDCGKLYFIPCTTQGGPASIYPGVYDMVNEEIDRVSKLLFV